MSSLVEVEVMVRIDGQVQAGYPFIRRILVAETFAINYQQAQNGSSYVNIPGTTTPPSRQVLIVKSDTAVNIALNGISGAAVPLNAGGLLIIIDETDTAAPQINNPASSTGTATVQGVAGGT